ncbi:MAG: PilZ domain-containing protein [Phycisphaerae bacterium]|nr:PilZ domain-containing protein [Phycisphaerae bacterium]
MTVTVLELAAAKADALLADVVGRNVAVCIEIKEGDTCLHYRSRFLGLSRGKASVLQMERPLDASTNHAHRFQLGAKMIVNFTWQQRRYRFATVAVQNSTFRLAGGAAVEGFTALWPAVIQSIQRRTNFRATLTQRVDVWLWQGGLASRDMAQAGAEPIWHGRIVNLAVGGLLMQFYGRGGPTLQLNERVGIDFQLDPMRPVFSIESIVRRISTNADGALEVGLQFAGLDSRLDGPEIQAILYRLTDDAQRQALRRQR